MKWIDICLMNSRAAGTVRLVLMILARGSNAKGFNRLPMQTIGKMAGRSAETVRDALIRLCDLKEIALVEQGGGKAKANTYRITIGKGLDFPDWRMLPKEYCAK